MSRPGGASWIGRIFGDGENPLLWSIPIGIIGGVAVRVHLVFVLFGAIRLVQSIPEQNAGPLFQGAAFLGLVILVGVYECGHVLGARLAGQEVEQSILWPLGGLSRGHGANGWRGLLLGSLGGPAVGLCLLPILAGGTWYLTGGWDLVVFNPFEFGQTSAAVTSEGFGAWFIWSLHASNAVLLAFNLLLPMHPMACGRIAQAAFWSVTDEARSIRLAAMLGLLVAMSLAAVGLLADQAVLIGIAAFGGFVCWQDLARARFLALDASDWTMPEPLADEEPVATGADPLDVDRILAKISSEGMDSLSEEERRALDRASTSGRGN